MSQAIRRIRELSITQILNAEREVAKSGGRGTVTEITNAILRSQLSTRKVVAREGNRRGLVEGIDRKSVDRAALHRAAVASANGRDRWGYCAVPDRWKRVFVWAFVKAAVHASSTNRQITVDI